MDQEAGARLARPRGPKLNPDPDPDPNPNPNPNPNPDPNPNPNPNPDQDNYRAHAWLHQLEGRKLYVLCAPDDEAWLGLGLGLGLG